jgi:ATP-dependent Zn protease
MIGDYTIYKEGNALLLSEDVKMRLNQDVDKILKECMAEVEMLLRKEKDIFERFAHELLQKNELDYDEIEAIFNEFGKANPRKFGNYTPGNEPPKV